MSGFRKAKAEQAALKLGLYGPSGSGKTFTALLLAEGLSKITGKKVAMVDTEHGSDFYCQAVKDRKFHPEAFDFDALYSKSITEAKEAIENINGGYGIIIIDSITHLWESARLAYAGKTTSIGTIPFTAWAKIKKPYKDMINALLSSPMHVIICGRQGNEFEEDEESGELKKVGVKMKAEGETPYEPHILIRMEAEKDTKKKEAVITAFVEKDRTGILAGKTIAWPTFDNIVKPIIPLLGNVQAVIPSDDDVGRQDAERLMEDEQNRIFESDQIKAKFVARIALCETVEALKTVSKEITPEVKKRMTSQSVADVREAYLAREKELGAGKLFK